MDYCNKIQLKSCVKVGVKVVKGEAGHMLTSVNSQHLRLLYYYTWSQFYVHKFLI